MMMNIFGDQKSVRRIRYGWYVICLVITLFAAGCASQSNAVNDGSSRRKLAEEYYLHKAYDKAKHELESILLENPKDIESLFLLGLIYGKQGSMNVSCSAFKKIISIDPQYSKAYYNIGVLYARSKSPEGIQAGMKYFDKFLELEPASKLRKDIEEWESRHLNP